MLQGPNGYIAHICEVHMEQPLKYTCSIELEQYNKMSVLHFFLIQL